MDEPLNNRQRRQWNLPHITSERFDDEVVVVNFESGKYHSIQGDGVAIWQWLEARPTVDGLAALAIDRFEGAPDQIEHAVRAFVNDLEREHLIVTAPVDAESRPIPETIGPPAAFRAPALTTFSDMQELLWLDPIHEVDESGWPVQRDDAGH